MGAKFNHEEFERLTGSPLYFYVIEICKEGNGPADFIDYFKANFARWDRAHLHVALGLLRKLDTAVARHLIADYFNHSLPYVRFTVYTMLDQMELIDDYVMSRIDDFSRSPERVREFGGADEVKRFRDQAMKRLVP